MTAILLFFQTVGGAFMIFAAQAAFVIEVLRKVVGLFKAIFFAIRLLSNFYNLGKE